MVNSKITESLLNREAVSFWYTITHQSHLKPPEKRPQEATPPPTPLEIESFWIPASLGISVAIHGGGEGNGYFLELHTEEK